MWLDHIANDLSTLLLLLLSYYGFFLQYLQNPIHIVCFMVLLLPSPLDPLSVLPLSDIKATCESVLGGKIVLWWLGIEHQAQSTKLMSNWEFEHITLKSVKPWYQSTHLSKLYSTYLRILLSLCFVDGWGEYILHAWAAPSPGHPKGPILSNSLI